MSEGSIYLVLQAQIKARIQQDLAAATRSVNQELLALYWDEGRLNHIRQQQKGWGAGITRGLACDIGNELPDTARLPADQSELVQQHLIDSYIFDFLTTSEPFRERVQESGLLKHLKYTTCQERSWYRIGVAQI